MPRPRTPLAKARVTGRIAHDPQRFRHRKEPKSDALGAPSKWLSTKAKAAWKEFAAELPWLNQSHRGIVEIACHVRARMQSGTDLPIAEMNLLRQCLGQMGATPADASKVSAQNDEELDPAEAEFFGRG